MTLLPSQLDVPISTAARLEFEGVGLTARDVSYALAVAWLAARIQPEDGTLDHYRIADNRLRATLGRTRRNAIEVEEARFDRLRAATIRIGDVVMPAPTLMYRNDAPVRSNLDDELTWVVSGELVDHFRHSQDHIMLPLRLLADARNRPTIEVVMKLLAQHAVGEGEKGTFSWSPDRVAIRMTFPELGSFLGIDASRPSVVMQRHLDPVVKDAFDAAGITFQYEARRAATLRNPNGKYRDLTMLLVMPSASPLEDAIRAEKQARSRGWTKQTPAKKRGRPKKAADPAPVADTTNVTVLRQARPAFARPEFGKSRSNVSGLPEDLHANAEGDIEF